MIAPLVITAGENCTKSFANQRFKNPYTVFVPQGFNQLQPRIGRSLIVPQADILEVDVSGDDAGIPTCLYLVERCFKGDSKGIRLCSDLKKIEAHSTRLFGN